MAVKSRRKGGRQIRLRRRTRRALRGARAARWRQRIAEVHGPPGRGRQLSAPVNKPLWRTLPRRRCACIICGDIAPGKFITFFYAVLNVQSRQMMCINAGHSAPIILKHCEKVLRLSGAGAVLGVFPNNPMPRLS